MAPSSELSSVSVQERNRSEITSRRGSQVDRVCLECSNPKGSGIQKFAANEHIVCMLNAVENAFQNCQRAWEGKLPQGFRSTKFCKIEMPNAWRWKGRQASQCYEQGKPVRAAVISTRYSTAFVRCICLSSP